MMRKKTRELKGAFVYMFLEDYKFLKEYCAIQGQRGDYSHIIKVAIHEAVEKLRKIHDVVRFEDKEKGD